MHKEDRPAKVPLPTGEAAAKHAGEARELPSARWNWVEPCVWTSRMLRALDECVKGGRWFSLMDKVWSLKISDGDLLQLVGMYLKQPVEDEGACEEPESGSPQGAVISPLLSNIYLDDLDQMMVREGREMVRYADDLVMLCRSEREAQEALARLMEWARANGLTVHAGKTRIVDSDERGGFDFLGYHFERGMKWPREKSVMKLREAIRSRTRRANGRSLEQIIGEINGMLRGWFAYFKHSKATTFGPIDGWIRMRLRSILRRRSGKRGRGRGSDHQRWPNDYFARRGYFSLKAAHAVALRSSRR